MIVVVRWTAGRQAEFLGVFLDKQYVDVGSDMRFMEMRRTEVPPIMSEHVGEGGVRATTVYRLAEGTRLTDLYALEIAPAATHGVWWRIAGAGWVSGISDGPSPAAGSPLWGGSPLAFTELEARRLAAEWGDTYEARPLAAGAKPSC